jgi:hypothetical protein
MLHATLLYPPVTDATAPYHSLIYLASFARRAGFDRISIRDTNVEALNYCGENSAALLEQWRSRRRDLASRPSLSGAEQLEYLQLTRAEALEPERIASASATLRDPGRFYDYRRYAEAARTLSLWFESLSCSAWPGQFEPGGQSLRRSGWLSLSSISDLTNEVLLDRLIGPFLPYFETELFPALVRQPPRVVGINITYTSQLPYALWMVRRLRRLLPEAFLACGGTEVSGVWKYLRQTRDMAVLFEGADACVIGEGESAFVRILEEALENRAPAPIPNVVRIRRNPPSIQPPPSIRYEDLDSLPQPEYGLLDASLYFSPQPLVYYSPTRGCYWNKCTFCDYGLNFGTPTSPWRQESLEKTVEQLRAVSAYSRHVYLSVDVLAPGRLLPIAEAIQRAGIDIRWAAEIRLERFFTRERCEALRRSGCVAVSVGYESGSQRVLDLIDKGVRLEDVRNTIRGFADAGVAVQMMGFTGYPSETVDEAISSVSFLEETKSWWTTAALGDFVLTPGAIVARKMQAENPLSVQPLKGDDIVRTLRTRSAAVADDPEAARTIERAKDRLHLADFDRPFAGGVDCAHSIFYYDRYGREFPHPLIARSAQPWRFDRAAVLAAGAPLAEERFDLTRMAENLRVSEMWREAASRNQALDHEAFARALASIPAVSQQDPARNYVVRADGMTLSCSPAVVRALAQLRCGTPAERIAGILLELLDEDDLREFLVFSTSLRRLTELPQPAVDSDSAPDPPLREALETLAHCGFLRVLHGAEVAGNTALEHMRR